MQVKTFADLDAVSRAAIDDLAALVGASSAPFHIALSGGTTPKRMFDLLVERGKQALPWDRIHLWWGDERCVPPEHPDSNYGMTKQHLIDPLELDVANIHRIIAEDDPNGAARAYNDKLVAALGSPPTFDLVWLGMGPDGHTASLFPKTAALAERAVFCVANQVDSPVTHGATTRITLTYPALNAAKHVRFLAAGADKAGMLATIVTGVRDPDTYPAQGIEGEDVVWLVDTAAASRLA